MSKQTWKTYAFWIALSEAVGALSGWLARDGIEIYQAQAVKPPFSPPGSVFPVVWTILFALMGVGAARVYLSPASRDRSTALWLFGAQLFFNFFWTIIFFTLQNYGLALIWLAALWVLIFEMIPAFQKIDALASRLQIPYLLWVSFAAYLNLGVWLLDR